MRKSTGLTKKKISPSKIPKEKVIKPFADGTLSNSQFFGMLRSALRQKSRFYHSIKVARERSRVPYTGINKRRKWMYRCEICNRLYNGDEINIHHRFECGSLTSFEDLVGFTQRLFCDSKDLIVACNECHDKIHNKNQ